MGRYSPARGRELTRYESVVERFASTHLGAWLFLHVISPIDRRLLPLSRGHVSLAVGAPVGLLQTVGVRSGRIHRTPLLYLRDRDAVVLIASNGGSPHHPGWLHNIRANPYVWFLSGQVGWRRYRARMETGAARAQRWSQALDLFAGYSKYQQRTHGREIPIVVLEEAPRSDPPTGARGN
jgi:deazaflavin-dependent oxidoreductase (nitroreductase family)